MPNPRWTLAGMAMVFAGAGVVALACQSAVITGREADAFAAAEWWRVSTGTLFGRVWWLRQGLMLGVLVLGLMMPWTALSRTFLALLAAMATAAGAASGHAAALEPSWPAVLLQAVHFAALGVWWGGLLPLALAFRGQVSFAAQAAMLKAFSRRATWMMSLLLLSGIYLAWQHVGRWPALFGTTYGQWLMLKLTLVAVVLLVAARLRWHWLPVIQRPGFLRPALGPARLVMFEWAVAFAVMAIAVVLAQVPPGRHDQVLWPFAFRFAPAVGWVQPGAVTRMAAGGTLLALALALLPGRWLWSRKPTVRAGAVLAGLTGAAVALSALTIPAFPDTYRSSEVPYHAISIHSGARLFRQHCTECHGAGGLGDGPRAKSLSKLPADLSAPHTADHTAGDMFWWLSHGMPSGAMPGFSGQLDEESRWDLVNYLRAFSTGYQGRVIRPQIAPRQPWLGAPDLDYATQRGVTGSLRALRGQRAALLVFFSWPQSRERLQRLAESAGPASDAFVLALPWHSLPDAVATEIPLPVATQGAEETVSTYALFRRTLARPDSGDRLPLPSHMEVLIDRFGYIRARWIPEESEDWQDLGNLRRQIRFLGAEAEILPPPDEHIH